MLRSVLRVTILCFTVLAFHPVCAQQAAEPPAQDISPPDAPATDEEAPAAKVEPPARPLPRVTIPNYWDPRRRPEKPAAGSVRAIRFMTELDYPPFSFSAADGTLVGFNVDLARALCLELDIPCTIQARAWETLIPALREDRGDAIIASLALTPEMHEALGMSDRYLANPGRFVARTDAALAETDPQVLSGKRIAVVSGTAHEAFLQQFFGASEIVSFKTPAEARDAMRNSRVDALFADGIGLSFWLNGAASQGCCRFVGGPYTQSRYFGEGMAIGVLPEDDALRRALNYALSRLHETGAYEEIYLKYFPISFY